MSALLTLIISLLSFGPMEEANVKPVQETTTYYFIRHAEKDESDPKNQDPALSAEGQQRAAKWAKYFEDADVDFDLIMSTDYNRTRTTASKIAEAQKKEVVYYDPRNLNDPDFQEKTKGKTVLVVGHSNTNPAFVNQIIGSGKYKALDEKEYGSLFKVTISPEGEKTSEVQYIN